MEELPKQAICPGLQNAGMQAAAVKALWSASGQAPKDSNAPEVPTPAIFNLIRDRKISGYYYFNF